MKRLMRSFGYAFNGIGLLIGREPNARIHMAAMCCTVVGGFVFGISASEWIAVALACGGVLTTEAVNSAVEALSDAVSPERNPGIKVAKDLAAGAVLLAAVSAAVVGCIVFVPRITAYIYNV
jgi:diacylglycerol kinase (ATP)